MPKRLLLLFLALLSTTPLDAQVRTGTVQGSVLDSVTQQPIAGARIIAVGTNANAVSRTDGAFTLLNVPEGTRLLRLNAIGYTLTSRSITVTGGQITAVTVPMTKSVVQLAAATVVGYGTQEKREITGSVGAVTAAQIRDIPTSDPMKALQGRISGVEIVTTSNEPGSPMQVRIRGVRSMASGRNEPLYVVDGVPITGGIEDFNPSMIEGISVLKDAAATAIYGSRGANGVILVTTKRGTMGTGPQATYSFDTYYGAQQPVQITPMMKMNDFVRYLQMAAVLNGQDSSLATVLQGQTFVTGTTTSKRMYAYQNGIETDWQRATLRDGMQRSMQGGVMGGSENTRYNISGNYFSQQGLIPGQADTRGTAFGTIDHVGKRFRVGASIFLSRALTEMGVGQGAFGYATAMTPFGRPYNYTNPDSAGILDTRPDDDALNINPLLEARSMIREQRTTRAFGSFYAEVDLPMGFMYRASFGPDFTNGNLGCYNDPWTHGPCNNPGANSANQGQPAQAMVRDQTDFSYTVDNQLNYTRDFGTAHHLEATLLHSFQKDRFVKDSMYASQLPYDTQLWYDIGSGTAGNNLSLISEWAMESMMARVNYTFLNRYSISASGRNDGSSRLAPGNKWAFFPSFGVAWQLGEEDFMRRFSWLDELKVRGSFGTTGNTSIAPYQTQGTLTPKLYTFGTTRVRGYRPGSIPNPQLGWEKTDQTDFGFEFSVLRGRISGSFDAYRQNTRDLLLTRLLPASSGYTSVLQNIGSTRNTGVEIDFTTVNYQSDNGLTWTSGFTFSKNKNKITALASGSQSDVGNVWFVGQPINLFNATTFVGDPQRRVFYDWKYLGIWQYTDSAEFLAFNANGSTIQPGDPRVADINGDGRINADDRTIVGTSYPKWVGSMVNTVSWRGFDVSALVTAKIGYTIQDGTPRSYTGRLGIIDDDDYWTPTNPTNRNPKPALGQVERLYATTRLYTSGSHWRIRNITVGYTVPERLAARVGARSIRFYGTAQDPYIASDYLGNDPEVAGAAPTLRTILFGSNIRW